VPIFCALVLVVNYYSLPLTHEQKHLLNILFFLTLPFSLIGIKFIDNRVHSRKLLFWFLSIGLLQYVYSFSTIYYYGKQVFHNEINTTLSILLTTLISVHLMVNLYRINSRVDMVIKNGRLSVDGMYFDLNRPYFHKELNNYFSLPSYFSKGVIIVSTLGMGWFSYMEKNHPLIFHSMWISLCYFCLPLWVCCLVLYWISFLFTLFCQTILVKNRMFE